MVVETPKNKHKIELKDWITGFEFEEIQKPILDVKFKINTLGQGDADINVGEATRMGKEKSIEVVVISVDGDKKDILKRVMEMPSMDYKFILGKIDEIVSGNFTKPTGQKQEDGIE